MLPKLEFRFPLFWKERGCGWLLQIFDAWILSSCRCSCKSGHGVPIYLQQDKMFFLQLFISIWIEKCYTFKGLSYIFLAIGNIILERCWDNMTKYRQQSVRLKELIQDGAKYVLLCLRRHRRSSDNLAGNRSIIWASHLRNGEKNVQLE